MMKKIYIFTAALLAAVTISAQRSYQLSPLQFEANSFERDDTIGPGAAFTAPVLYNSTNGGYVVGNNGYDDKQKAQIFYPTDISFIPVPFTTTGALYWFGGKGVGANGNVKLGVYRIDGSGTAQSGTVPCPNSLIVQDVVTLGSIDTALNLGNITAHMFSSAAPQPVLNPDGYYSFGVGFDVTALGAGDSIGLVSSTDGDVDAAFPAASWEQWSDNTWHSFEEDQNWDLSLDLAIFPIGFNAASIDDPAFLNGVSVNAVSPFSNAGQFTYHTLNDVDNATINIINMNGAVVYTKVINNLTAGKYILDYDGSDLTAGAYFITFQAGKGRIASKFIKQ